jgi:hypothetical protein
MLQGVQELDGLHGENREVEGCRQEQGDDHPCPRPAVLVTVAQQCHEVPALGAAEDNAAQGYDGATVATVIQKSVCMTHPFLSPAKGLRTPLEAKWHSTVQDGL